MSQITPDQLQALLNYAAGRLGMSPEQLATTVQNGGLSALEGKLGKENTAHAQTIANNRGQLEQLLGTPAAQALLEKLSKGR